HGRPRQQRADEGRRRAVRVHRHGRNVHDREDPRAPVRRTRVVPPSRGDGGRPGDGGAAPARRRGGRRMTGTTEYVCPMHPQIVRSQPGSCPICGMALEPRVATLGDEPNPELVDMTRRFRWSLLFTLPTFALAMSDLLPGRPVQRAIDPRVLAWIELALAAPVVVWGGSPLFRRGWDSLVARSLNMFTLIALRPGAAVAFRLFAPLFPSALPHALR